MVLLKKKKLKNKFIGMKKLKNRIKNDTKIIPQINVSGILKFSTIIKFL